MNFSELQPGANFYILSTNNGLSVAVGTVKGKTAADARQRHELTVG